MALAFTILGSLVICSAFSLGNALSSNYYEKKCPGAEAAISKAIKEAAKKDKSVPAGLLRLHFHDCFIRGCDASVLLDSTRWNKAEKEGQPNLSLHGFFAIDNAKRAVETICPGVVSCADVLALAARDAVVLSGGPRWDVPKGRKDGRSSCASETLDQLPPFNGNLSQLQKIFSKIGLDLEDLVALSGGHTLGFAHCSSFENRIYPFDPSMQACFAASLRRICPMHNTQKYTGAFMDLTPTTFDNIYFKQILQGQSLFSSDHALLTSSTTKNLVSKFAGSNEAFYDAFVKSMIKMSSIRGGEEVRRDCRKVN